MFFVILVFVLAYVMNVRFVISDTSTVASIGADDDYLEEKMDPLGDHTFVALLDIVFTDNSKRTCTGTIIQDSVVLTAAHCFTNPDNIKAKPELLASFVVIGTKKMFSTGYEHYLPIEKILIHPKYQGWTADIALVFTFASMTGHKEGTILPLAGERTSTHVDANVTVLSWGPSQNIEEKWKKKGDLDSEECNSDDDKGALRSGGGRRETAIPYRMRLSSKDSEEVPRYKSVLRTGGGNPDIALRSEQPSSIREAKAKRYLAMDDEVRLSSKPTQIRETDQMEQKNEAYRIDEEVIIDNDFVTEPAFLAAYVESLDTKSNNTPKNVIPNSAYINMRKSDQINDDELESQSHNANPRRFKHNMDFKDPEIKSIYINPRRLEPSEEDAESQTIRYHNSRRFDRSVKAGYSIYRRQQEEQLQPPTLDAADIKSHYRNWRRQMGSQQNQLKVDIYGFVNQKVCEGMVEKVMPEDFHLASKNDVVCFSADDHFITDDDSGAPVVRRGKLIAVAIGGVRVDDVHVAIGMKMSCYCSWIAENLPEPNQEIACCLNCCEVTHWKEGAPLPVRREPKKKIISF